MKKQLRWMGSAMLVGAMAVMSPAAEKWETDFQKASETAKAANRYMLLDFSGSDWCGWCIRLDKEVFSQKAFQTYADENLVCVLLDFPRGKSIPKKVKEQNEKLAQKYGVKGFPTVLVLSPDGTTVAQTGYQEGGADNYVKHLKSFIDPHRKKNNVPAPTAAVDEKAKPGIGKASKKPAPVKLPSDENREMRTWKSTSGDTIKASLVEEQGLYAVLKTEDGKKVRIMEQRLSEEDRKYIAELKDKSAAKDEPAKEEPVGKK